MLSETRFRGQQAARQTDSQSWKGSQRQVAERFQVGRATVERLVQHVKRTGSPAPKPHGGGQKPRITEADRERILGVEGVREMVESVGARLFPLPRYSPDLSPIEQAWGKIKHVVKRRRVGHRQRCGRMVRALWLSPSIRMSIAVVKN